MFPLKDQLQVELQFPHVDAGYGAGDRAKASIGCARDGDAVRTELARVQSVIRIAEVRVVEEIEGLKPELQVLALTYEKAFLATKIDAEDYYTDDNIAAGIPKRVLGLECEGLNVEPIVRRLRGLTSHRRSGRRWGDRSREMSWTKLRPIERQLDNALIVDDGPTVALSVVSKGASPATSTVSATVPIRS